MQDKMVAVGLLTIALTVFAISNSQAWAITDKNGFSQTVLASNEIKNNPLAMKILQNIEISKQMTNAQIQKQAAAKQEQQYIDQQRRIAENLRLQALQTLQTQTMPNNSQNSFSRFVSTVQNDNTKNVFLGEFNLMQQKVDAGNAAMKKILDSGGTWQDAMNAFSSYAAVKKVDMIKANKNLNVQYGLADSTTQAAFNENGLLPDNYIQVPKNVLSH